MIRRKHPSGLLHLPEGDQWRCRVDQDKERDCIVHA